MCHNKEKTIKITLEEDCIKQPFLKLYAKLKGKTNGINKPHADESGARYFEREMFRACPCALNNISSQNHIGRGFNEATISETICQTQGKS